MTKPLSPEEEADLRGDIANENAWRPMELGFKKDLERLFATLDASRAENEALKEELRDIETHLIGQCLDKEVAIAKGGPKIQGTCLVETPIDLCPNCLALSIARAALSRGKP